MTVVLITGASRGIGLEIARTLYRQGYEVIGTSRQPSSDEGFTMLPLDVTAPTSVHMCVQRVRERFGRIDVLINNAGYDLYGSAEETSYDTLQAQIETNFSGSVRLIQAVLPLMREQGGGKIINMSSIGGFLALPFNSAYAASKFALEGYSESLRYEVRQFGIYVSLVQPGSVRTDTLDTSIMEVTPGLPPYERQRSGMVSHMRQTGASSRTTPADVAQTVLKIIQTPRPRLRYPVGTLARWMPLMKQILPQSVFERFIAEQFLLKGGSRTNIAEAVRN